MTTPTTRAIPASRLLTILLALALLLPTMALAPPGALAATCQVKNGNDSGAGSLRAALSRALEYTGLGCETITFAPGVTEVRLTSWVPIRYGVTINGNGMDKTTLRYVDPVAREN